MSNQLAPLFRPPHDLFAFSMTMLDTVHVPPLSIAHESATCNALRSKRERPTSLDHQVDHAHREPASVHRQTMDVDPAVNHIARLPPDMLEEIFERCVIGKRRLSCTMGQPGKTEAGVGKLDMDTAPWVLLQVSRFWRHIASNYAAMWAHVFLDLEHPGHLRRFQVHCTRARARPLHVVLWASGRGDVVSDLFQAVLSTSTRWRSIQLNCPHSLFRFVRSLSLPLLSSFTIDMVPVSIHERASFITCFSRAPVLRSICVTTSHKPSRVGVIQRTPSALMDVFALPWAQITDVAMDNDADRYLSPTLGTQQLRRVAYNAKDPRRAYLGDSDPRRVNVCSSVWELVITGEETQNMPFMFSNVEFPSLLSLTINGPSRRSDSDCIIPVFTPRTAPCLTSLTTYMDTSGRRTEAQTYLIALLRCMPRLTRLTLVSQFDEVYDSLDTLLDAFSQEKLVPVLEVLDMSQLHLSNIALYGTGLETMIRSRWESGMIKTIALRWDAGKTIRGSTSWAALMKDGLKVSFTA